MGSAWSDARRRRDARNLNGGEAVSGSPVPELAVVVVAPALHRAVRQQGTRVVVTKRDARRRRDTRDFDGGGAVDNGPVPELAVAVKAPALHHAVRQQGTRGG